MIEVQKPVHNIQYVPSKLSKYFALFSTASPTAKASDPVEMPMKAKNWTRRIVASAGITTRLANQ
jgi:hypothetical protein